MFFVKKISSYNIQYLQVYFKGIIIFYNKKDGVAEAQSSTTPFIYQIPVKSIRNHSIFANTPNPEFAKIYPANRPTMHPRLVTVQKHNPKVCAFFHFRRGDRFLPVTNIKDKNLPPFQGGLLMYAMRHRGKAVIQTACTRAVFLRPSGASALSGLL